MVKAGLKTDIKQGFLLLLCAFMLYEILSIPTLVFVVITFLAMVLQTRPGKILRNAFALAVFISYAVIYGKVIDPEVGLNFLVTVISLKLLEKDSKRDDYMIFFGLILLTAAGSLFEKTLTYMIFFVVSFFFLIQDFYLELGLKGRIRELGTLLLWVFPVTGAMFFLIPRMMNPIPFQYGKSGEGEVGYTPNVNISSLESLSSNDGPAFQAITDMEVPPDKLYWRGNTLSQSDGWNWFLSSQDYGEAKLLKEIPISRGVEQTIKLFQREEYFFTLDYPTLISARQQTWSLRGPRSLNQPRWQWRNQYTAISLVKGRLENDENPLPYLRESLPKKDREWVLNQFKGKTVSEIQKEVGDYFRKERFTYSFKPGRVESFRDFMRLKKIGVCSHYASATAHILRTKNIPARLVSGYLGGNYNSYANYYLISHNDAHVWVEALENEKWIRLDPTEWIAPDRVRLGGEAFITSLNPSTLGGFKIDANSMRWLKEVKMWFQQWDFKFYQWIEQMDYFTQEAWLYRFKIKRQWLFFAAPVLILIFAGLYGFQLSRRRTMNSEFPALSLWRDFLKKMDARGIHIPRDSLRSGHEFLLALKHRDQEKILKIWESLVEVSYQQRDIPISLKEQIKNL